MRLLYGFLVYFLSCGTLQGVQDYEITYPERLHSRRHRRDLSTAIDGGHEHSVKYAIKALKKTWIIDANINDRVTSQKILLRQFDADDNETITQESPDICHYQGSIKGIPESVVALSTCSGLSGVIDDGVETYHIEPYTNFQETGAHKIYPAKRRKEFGMPREPDFYYPNEYGNDVTKQTQTVRRNVANVEEQYKPYLTTNETRYNEVFFVVDNGIYKRFGKNTKTVVERVIALCNVLDAIYQRINIRIVLHALEIWTNGPRFRRHWGDFKLFGDYLKNEINSKGKITYDNAHFLSHYGWRAANGLGWIGAMCTSDSFAINTWSYDWSSYIGPYVVVAHEMGHNFNFPHAFDKDKCKCLSPKGCVMQYYPAPRILGFTECSLNALKKINDRCLYNVPTKAINSKCGNGIREGDEECDCGTPEMCKAKDPCCMPHDCRLKPEALCSDLHHSCCKDCLFKRQGTLCRPVKTDCDVPEYCPGDSRDCPADISLQDGTPCNKNKSVCFTGKCAETRDTQCRDLWGPKSDSANRACYDKLNTEAKGYGTCDAKTNSPCAAADVLCGQIQCSSTNQRPVVDYGKSYKQIILSYPSSSRCSAAVLKNSDMVGRGMVNDGTKCGDQKMCMSSKCQSFQELNITKCPSVKGLECNGKGRCTNLGSCHCHFGYDPQTACEKVLQPIDGAFTTWTAWSTCDKGCDTGKQSRHRYCTNPAPKHGGKDCEGAKKQEQYCNKVPCPRAYSCRHLQMQAISSKLDLPDGIYKIFPHGLSRQHILVYCDMTRDEGGWTLLVTSRTNTWTDKNILLRNVMLPSLTHDYSILKYADDIKNNKNAAGRTFEYRLEAQTRGRWGGIWQADRSYTFTATTNVQTDVKLIKKFDNWDYSDNGIEKRMPWIKMIPSKKKAILTTSRDAYRKFYGTIAAPFKKWHPAPWISGPIKSPDVIWYWMREGPGQAQQ